MSTRKTKEEVKKIWVKHVKNPVKIEFIPGLKDDTEYAVLGAPLVPQLFTCISLVGGPGSGKTLTMFNMMKRACGPKCIFLLFVSTLHENPQWKAIVKYLKKKGHVVVENTSIWNKKGDNMIEQWIKAREIQAEMESKQREAELNPTPQNPFPHGHIFGGEKPDPKNKKREHLATQDAFLIKKGAETFQYPGVCIVCDDLGKEMRDNAMGSLQKTVRHSKVLVIVACQDQKDENVDARGSVGLWCLFKGIAPSRLRVIYEAVGPAMTYETFESMYKDATSTPHQYFSVNKRSTKFMAGTSKDYEVLPDDAVVVKA
jgi:hypothetical protein